ncbi:hypothetical protein OGAPHI_006408 [Ogataea philodendri]|uniref:Nuclear pore complex protein n=1 Tax=Ogataea philodendri TaxID=1378263 RepID=A0A9P8NXG0_9ASCO|nr:uncharacterized protein OGAPHI_006408 [Ogataea philodendri]KAH3661560.1 hypothetical protein OGAPHI_006408 [Ogataea philodendri]
MMLDISEGSKLSTSPISENFSRLDPQVEDENVNIRFAKVLKDFRLNFGEQDVSDIVRDFKACSAQELLKAYEQSSDTRIIENWILESQFWNLIEVLEKKFTKESQQVLFPASNGGAISKYTSGTLLSDKILTEHPHLSQLYSIIQWLSESLKFNLIDRDDMPESSSLPATKWLATKMKLQTGKYNGISPKFLDDDSFLRLHSSKGLDSIDKDNEDIFFRIVYHLLLQNEPEKISELCENTNNWTFILILTGVQKHFDPRVDLDDYNSKPLGIIHSTAWRQTIYKLTKSEALNPNEKACYGFLCGDVSSCESQANSWEAKLLIYLNNMFQYELEEHMALETKHLMKSNAQNLQCVSSLPPKYAGTIVEVLNLLASAENECVREQSKHPLRVLMGSVISNNVKELMKNCLRVLQNLLAEPILDLKTFELTSDAYLLRVLVHFAIILQLIFGDEIISHADYTQLLQSYISRLTLYELYDLIPIYISFIPDDHDLVNTYSHLLSHYQLSDSQRFKQLKIMQQLNLPLQSVLRNSVADSFDSTKHLYQAEKEIRLNFKIEEVDRNLYNTAYWFYDAGMISDCIESLISLSRRFLLCGKLQAFVEMVGFINLSQVIKDYKFNVESVDGFEKPDLGIFRVQAFKLSELFQYQALAGNFRDLWQFEKELAEMSGDRVVEKAISISSSLETLAKTFLLELSKDPLITTQDLSVYHEMRRLYIPTIFDRMFDMLMACREHSSDLLVERAVKTISILGASEFHIYEIFQSSNELMPFLKKYASFSSEIL